MPVWASSMAVSAPCRLIRSTRAVRSFAIAAIPGAPALIAAVNIAWLLAGSGLTGLFREPRSNRIVNLIFAMLLLASLAAAIRW